MLLRSSLGHLASVSCSATVAGLGVRVGIPYVAMLVAAETLKMRAGFPCVTLLHQPIVSASFGLRQKDPFYMQGWLEWNW
ncbi:hypothetical protein BDV30DRAFT_151210 [Aspergillus minisclerotigenes]|uniref:Uncharacterized protein n=1 Tax=Aspergillus minisclerotigenes TaxID=656917 RepID=A0A5N6IXF2_9EURO|nr:hypothetical protein BDV30DRAFT_151210 [Aspergillus minisclerotigenes]